MTAGQGWFWGTRRSVALKAGGVALVALVMLGGAALGVLNAPRAAAGGASFVDAGETAGPAGRGIAVLALVTGKEGDRLSVRTARGRTGSIVIGPETVVRRGRQRAAAADIHEGDQLAAIGILRPRARPPVLDASVIIIRPNRAGISHTPADAAPLPQS